jgi:hypothetical protein
VADGGPGSYVFTYGAFPNTDVPRSRPAGAAAPAPTAISDEEDSAT